jgi:hypothetical protein
VILKLASGLAASVYSENRQLRATYASGEPTQQQTLDLEWSADGRKVGISYQDKSMHLITFSFAEFGQEFLIYVTYNRCNVVS